MEAGVAKGWDLEEVRRVLSAAVARSCPPSMAADRDDIVQNAMIRVTEILSKGEESEIRNASYLWRVGYTATINEIRRRRRLREEPMEAETFSEPVETFAPDPERAAASSELGDGIRGCLLDLIEPRRYAVLLHLYGYGIKQSAEILGWPAKRVDNLRYRGLADLRTCLTSKGLTP